MYDTKSAYASSRKEWRAWFRKNHKKESKVRLVYYKKHTGKPSPSTNDAMDEAICWGWIDTTIRRIDDEKFSVDYVKRTRKSKWSNATFARAEREIKARRMTKAGMQAYESGKKNPAYDFGIPKNPKTPDFLRKALEKNKKAKENYGKITPSYRKLLLRWLLSAKRKETRDKRVKEIVNSMKDNRKILW